MGTAIVQVSVWDLDPLGLHPPSPVTGCPSSALPSPPQGQGLSPVTMRQEGVVESFSQQSPSSPDGLRAGPGQMPPASSILTHLHLPQAHRPGLPSTSQLSPPECFFSK